MACKILKASTYYPSALAWHYARRPPNQQLSYFEQHRALMRESIAWSDSWKRHLEATGDFIVEEIVVNAEPLQKQWAREHNITYRQENWAADIFFAQYAESKPQILFAHSHDLLLTWWSDPRARDLERAYVIGYDGTAKHLPAFVERCDLLLTCLQRSQSFYENAGLKAHYFPYGFETELLDRLHPDKYRGTEVSFVGGVALHSGHHRRAEELAQLSHCLPLTCWLSQVPRDRWKLLRSIAAAAMSGDFAALQRLPALNRLIQVNAGELYGIEMLSALAASKVTLNIHIDAAKAEAANVRLFEATGVGTCLVTDWKKNLADFFEPDVEIVTFKSTAEAAEKVLYLLAHDTERTAIASRGQQRTRKQHSTKARLDEIADLLRCSF